LFIPIESAYIAAIKEEPALFEEGIRANIILTCPNTLLSVLKVISYTWRLEKQQHNSQEIAEKAGLLYDKLCSFVNVIMDMGECFKNAQDKFDQAVKHLSTGRGNLVKRSEELKKLGVAGKKEMPQKLLEQCDGGSPEDGSPVVEQENGGHTGGSK
jgi:DNA recombination protein RmuC